MNKYFLKKLISEGKISEALDEILEFLKEIDNSELTNSFILKSSQLRRIYQEKNLRISNKENLEISQNQIESTVLNLIDQIEIEDINDETPNIKNKTASKDKNLLARLSNTLGRKVQSFPINNLNLIKHNIQLFEINSENLQSAEKAAAQWGELAPPIILHRIKQSNEKLNEIKITIDRLL